MAKRQTKEVTDPAQAFALLGYSDVELPGDAAVTTEEAAKVAPKAPLKSQPQMPQAPVTTEEPAETVKEPEQPTAPEPPAPPEVSAEELQRRTWQAEADRAKADLLKTQEQIRLLQAQNQQLLGVVTPFMQKYGQGQAPANGTEQINSDQEPNADFIEDGYFEPKKFAEYQKRRDIWLSRRLKSEIKTDWQKEREQETLQQQLLTVATEFPEYVNPLTGQVDVDRLHRDLQAYTAKKTIADLLREAKGIKPQGASPALAASLEAIQKNADRPQTVATSRETEKEKKPVPKKLLELQKTFGDIELPEGFDGLLE